MKITPNTVWKSPTLYVQPDPITPDIINKALTRALQASSPAAAEQAFRETLLDQLTKPYNPSVHPLTAPPTAASDEAIRDLIQEALLDCGGDNKIPVQISDPYNVLPATLKALILQYDTGTQPFTPETQNFALCLDSETRQELGMPQACYGKYIDEKLVGNLFSGRTLTAYSFGCVTAATLCGTKYFGVGTVLGLVEGLVGCELPVLIGSREKGRIVEELKKGGGTTALLGGTIAASYLGGMAFSGILNSILLRGITAQKAATELLTPAQQAGQAAGKAAGGAARKITSLRPSVLYSRRLLERVVDSQFRSLTGTSLPLQEEAKILSRLEPKDYAVLRYLCKKGCSQEFLRELATKTDVRKALYSEFAVKYADDLAKALTERIKLNGALVKRLIEEKTSQEMERLANILKQKARVNKIRFLPQRVKKAIEDQFISKGRLPTKEELRRLLEEYGVKRGKPPWNSAFTWLDKLSKDPEIQKMNQYQNLLRLAKENPKEALQQAKEMGLITKQEVQQLRNQYAQQVAGQVRKKFYTPKEGEKNPNQRTVKELMNSEDPFGEAQKIAGEAAGEASNEVEQAAGKVAEEAAKEAAEEAEGGSFRQGMKRAAACLTAGYLTGTLLASHTSDPTQLLNLPTLTLTLEDHTLKIGNLVIG